MSLDTIPLLDASGNPLSVRQGDHVRRFNELNRIMAGMPDLYEAGKTTSPEVLESLRKDFQDTWIISSTRIHYEKTSLEATITHYFNNTVISPNEIKVLVPDYSGVVSLDKVLKDEQGLKYLQALFNTLDSAETIKTTLENLSNKKSKDIRVWTPEQNLRKEAQDRAAGLGYSSGLFLVDGSNNISSDGRSRGVLVSPR